MKSGKYYKLIKLHLNVTIKDELLTIEDELLTLFSTRKPTYLRNEITSRIEPLLNAIESSL